MKYTIDKAIITIAKTIDPTAIFSFPLIREFETTVNKIGTIEQANEKPMIALRLLTWHLKSEQNMNPGSKTASGDGE